MAGLYPFAWCDMQPRSVENMLHKILMANVCFAATELRRMYAVEKKSLSALVARRFEGGGPEVAGKYGSCQIQTSRQQGFGRATTQARQHIPEEQG